MSAPPKRARLLPPRGLLLALAAQLPLAVVAWPLHPAKWEIAAGAAIALAGIALNVLAERLFRRHEVEVVPFAPAPVLIARGPYRRSRNPMYLGLVLVDLGVAIVSGVPANAWTALALLVWLHYAFVLPEEALLRREHGEAFEAYARRVRRWI